MPQTLDSLKPVAILLSALAAGPAFAQGGLEQTDWLDHPDDQMDFVRSCADYWLVGEDQANGGFFESTDATGQATSGTKVTLNQAHTIYGLVRAFQMTGEEAYLDAALRAQDFLNGKAWNPTQRRWYYELGATGNILGGSRNGYLTAFWQHYALLGLTTALEATADPAYAARLEESMQASFEGLWDPRPGYEGYYDEADGDFGNPRGKSFHSVVDALTTHAFSARLLGWPEDPAPPVVTLLDRFIEHFLAPMESGSIKAMTDNYDSNYAPFGGGGSTGHLLKGVWVLSRGYFLTGDPLYREYAGKVAEWVLDPQRGLYDFTNGSPYSNYNPYSGFLNDTTKEYWQMEQGFTGGITLWSITGEERYRTMAEESLNFHHNHFWDRTHGEVYHRVNQSGSSPTNPTKGIRYKGGYHSIELGWYAWWYGKLWITGEPVAVHYRFSPAAAERDIPLRPLVLPPGRLAVTRVERQTAPDLWEDDPGWPGTGSVLTLPAGPGGRFRVTYAGRPGPGPFSGPPAQLEGWIFTWMGWVYRAEIPLPGWYYHETRGWLWIPDTDPASTWAWTLSDGQWRWTNPTLHPWSYSATTGQWAAWE